MKNLINQIWPSYQWSTETKAYLGWNSKEQRISPEIAHSKLETGGTLRKKNAGCNKNKCDNQSVFSRVYYMHFRYRPIESFQIVLIECLSYLFCWSCRVWDTESLKDHKTDLIKIKGETHCDSRFLEIGDSENLDRLAKAKRWVWQRRKLWKQRTQFEERRKEAWVLVSST